MSCVGYPDLAAVDLVAEARVLRSFGGGTAWVEPSACDVLTRPDGSLDWELEIVRALWPDPARATLSAAVGTTYPLDEVLIALRETDAAAVVSPCALSDWLIRLDPAPGIAMAGELLAPVPLASAGLGRGRLRLPLRPATALVLEQLLQDRGRLPGSAEATLLGVSPRVPVVVRFDPAVLVEALLGEADDSGALPRGLLVSFFARDPADLPLELSGTVEPAQADAFAGTMADRVVARFGAYVAAHDPADGPVVRLLPADRGIVGWSLSEPALVPRRLTLDFDLLAAATAQRNRLGAESLVLRRDLADLPSLGGSRVTVLSTVPTRLSGVAALGVTLTFPPTRWRPQELSVSAVVAGDTADAAGDGSVDVAARLAPGEPLSYRVTPFAVVSDQVGTRQVDGITFDADGPVLRLAPEDFPVELVLCSAEPDLAAVAVLEGTCTFEQNGVEHRHSFTLDGATGDAVAAVAVPLEHDALRVGVLARARHGSGQVPLGPFEGSPVRLALASCPSYGPQRLTVRCLFDDGATSRALSLRPDVAADDPADLSTLVLTPSAPVRTYRWFASSPFSPGVRYREYGSTAEEQLHLASDGELVLTSSELAQPETHRVVNVTATPRGLVLPRRRETRVTESVLAGREVAFAADGTPEGAALDQATESAVVPVATSPSEAPVDDLVYALLDDPTSTGYVPRYTVDEQVVSGRSQYRVAMQSTAVSSTLTVHLVATFPPEVQAKAPDATELPHTLAVALEFRLSGGGDATKTLAFGDVTRSGSQVTAVLTFAGLAERDDVYAALTDPARRARLVVQRSVDLRVPVVSGPGTPVKVFPLPPSRVVGLGPRLGWPPAGLQLAMPPERVLTRPGGLLTRRQAPGDRLGPVAQPVAAKPVTVAPVFAEPRLPGPALPAFGRPRRVGLLAGRSVAAVEAGLVATVPGSVLGRRAGVLELRRRDDSGGDGGGGGDIGGDGGLGNGGGSPPPPPPPPPPVMPVPRLSVTSRNEEPGLTRFRLVVDNWADFPDALFAASPDLPPCGANANASRTWVDIVDGGSGARIYGFCALGAARDLTSLWFAVVAGSPAPATVLVRLTDRRTGVVRDSNAAPTPSPTVPPPPPPPQFRDVRVPMTQTVLPEPFWFSRDLHGYVFSGITPGTSGGNQLVRWSLPWAGRLHTYLQDATRPWVIYVFPDEFRIARLADPPYHPWMTARVSTDPAGASTGVVLDYMVAPHVDADRLRDAERQLVADPRFGQDRPLFQPFTTGDVSFTVDRPTESGAVREERADAEVVLRDALKDTIAMSLGDFRLLFDALHGRTATLFTGHVDIEVGDGTIEAIPFTARMELLEGPIFTTVAEVVADGSVRVLLTNQIESPLDVNALDVTLGLPTGPVDGTVRNGLPRAGLAPGDSLPVEVVTATPLPTTVVPDVAVDVSGVVVHPDAAAVLDAILDRETLSFFRLVTVKAVPGLFAAPVGRESEQIVSILVGFEHGEVAELTASALEQKVPIDYSIDDVLLHRPVSATYTYTTTVVRMNGQQQTSESKAGNADLFYVSVSP